MSRVALVLVSHSSVLADGVRDLAAAMAADVHIGVAGGLPGGGLGTSFELVEEALSKASAASGGDGVVILTDLGSATLTVDSALEFADDPDAFRYVDAPLVEGAVAAAVAAQQGEDMAGVARAATDAGRQWCPQAPAKAAQPEGAEDGPAEGDAVVLQVQVADPVGIHARPAAQLAAAAADYDAETTINDASAESMMELMSLGVAGGDTVVVRSTGRDAAAAVEAVARILREEPR